MKQAVEWFRENPGPAFAAVLVIGVPVVVAVAAMTSRLSDRQWGEVLLLLGVGLGFWLFIAVLVVGAAVALFKRISPKR